MIDEFIEELVLKFCEVYEWEITEDGIRHIKTLPFYSVVQSVKGQYEISIGGSETVFTGEGGCFIAPADVVQDIVHHLPPSKEPMRARWVFFNVKILGAIDLTRFFDIPMVIPAHEAEPFNVLMDELLELKKQPEGVLKIVKRHRVAFMLLELICSISAIKKDVKGKISEFRRLMPVLKFIDANTDQTVNVTALAEMSNLSVPRFYVLFKKAIGMSPMAYVHERRLSHACMLLVTTATSIREISDATGFYDQFHLSSAFRKKYGYSPLKYRKTYRDMYGSM